MCAYKKRFAPLLRDTLGRGQYEALRQFHPRTLDAHPGTESTALGAASNFLLTSTGFAALQLSSRPMSALWLLGSLVCKTHPQKYVHTRTSMTLHTMELA